jgi:hypothetical protein
VADPRANPAGSHALIWHADLELLLSEHVLTLGADVRRSDGRASTSPGGSDTVVDTRPRIAAAAATRARSAGADEWPRRERRAVRMAQAPTSGWSSTRIHRLGRGHLRLPEQLVCLAGDLVVGSFHQVAESTHLCSSAVSPHPESPVTRTSRPSSTKVSTCSIS